MYFVPGSFHVCWFVTSRLLSNLWLNENKLPIKGDKIPIYPNSIHKVGDLQMNVVFYREQIINTDRNHIFSKNVEKTRLEKRAIITYNWLGYWILRSQNAG